MARFALLLEEADKLDALDSLKKIEIALLPTQKPQHQKKVINTYEKRLKRKKELTPAIIEQESNRLMAILGIKQK